jgi:hypothetical protein
LTKFVTKGTGDEARAALQANFAAQNAAFEANLNALLKSPPQATVTEAPTKPPIVTDWALATDRNRRYKR